MNNVYLPEIVVSAVFIGIALLRKAGVGVVVVIASVIVTMEADLALAGVVLIDVVGTVCSVVILGVDIITVEGNDGDELNEATTVDAITVDVITTETIIANAKAALFIGIPNNVDPPVAGDGPSPRNVLTILGVYLGAHER